MDLYLKDWNTSSRSRVIVPRAREDRGQTPPPPPSPFHRALPKKVYLRTVQGQRVAPIL